MLLCSYSYSCAQNSSEEKKLFKTKEFHYIIYDEAHKLKNMTTQTFDVFSSFNVCIIVIKLKPIVNCNHFFCYRETIKYYLLVLRFKITCWN